MQLKLLPCALAGLMLAGTEGIGSAASPANRLVYLDESDPFYPGANFARLTTPQWVGEHDVEAVVILSIDDMREPAKYETFLRPILNRLKQIDGRAPVSIFCNALDPEHPQLRGWPAEGLSLEVHTLSHPCPCLAKGDLTAAAETYHGCVDLLNRIPGNKPVAFRMPCCDSMNSPSPRFYAEIFNGTNRVGQFLTMDSSVMNIPTADDRSLPREFLFGTNGRPRFQKYLVTETNVISRVTMKSFVTTIRDYPYPYVIGKLCWEFPAMIPSDWEAQNLHGVTNAATVEDWKAGLDITVLKQGTFSFIFHPHGWIRSEQLVEFIDYAVQKYGKKVKFLTFREAQERLDKYLLAGNPIRNEQGKDNGVRLLDLDADGLMDVVIGNERTRKSRMWDRARRVWDEQECPTTIDAGARFGVVGGHTVLLRSTPEAQEAWRFAGGKWTADQSLLKGLRSHTAKDGRDRGARFRDLDNDGNCELIVANDIENVIYVWSVERKTWQKGPFTLPSGASIVNKAGGDNGQRFVDLDQDGFDDVIFSNPDSYGIYLFVAKPKRDWDFEVGWSRKVRAGKHGHGESIPLIVRGGSHPNNGAWFHSGHMWIQNEETAHLPDKVDRRSFQQLLAFEAPLPKSPEESRAAIKVRPGFKVELVAAEPLVMDPVAFDWGADGKLWVVEMRDYPVGLDAEGEPGGSVRYLEDTDGDGRYDRSTVFLTGLSFPNGVMPWRKGVIVSAAPEIFYAEDRDGDGKADHRITLLEGFGRGNQQHRVNGFEYGLDNWVYGANGDSGGTIKANAGVLGPARTQGERNLRGSDFRFKPDDGTFEVIEGQTQFGRHRDDWGNWFGNNNPSWGWHYWIAERYVARNPHSPAGSLKSYFAGRPNATRVFAISQPMVRFNWPNHVNILTSANSVTPYRDELFGPEFERSVFISEPANNLVHREELMPNGVSFETRRPADEQDREFLASSDTWFRPTMLKVGPDGALYIADMYRLVIEHTEYAMPGMEKQIDVRAGADRGRIYRVFPEGAALRKIPNLEKLDTESLVRALDSPNGWQRDTAQRLIVHAREKSAEAPLRKLFRASKNPKVRLQALCALDGVEALNTDDVRDGLRDGHAIIRAHAVRFGELGKVKVPVDELIRLADDTDVRVRFQVALTLGEARWPPASAAKALARIAQRDFDDRKMRVAILSSIPVCFDQFIDRIHASTSASLREQLVQLCVALENDRAAATLVKGSVSPNPTAGDFTVLNGFLDSVSRSGKSLADYKDRPELREIIARFPGLSPAAASMAFDTAAAEQERLAAIDFLGRIAPDGIQVEDLLLPVHPVAVQKSALKALGHRRGDSVVDGIVQRWPQLSPAIRAEALELLLSRREWIGPFLAAVETNAIPRSHIPPVIRERLLKRGEVGERAKGVFGQADRDRERVIRQYGSAKRGNAANGAALFRQHCAACHRFKEEGTALGPDLAGLMDKSFDSILSAVLDPNQAVETPFVGYTVTTRDGRELSGIIAAESANSITLRIAGGGEHVLARSAIKEVISSGVSLMPEGLEQALDPQPMADLIEYVLAE